jgi:hypothetical protein
MGRIRKPKDLVSGTELNPGDFPLGSIESRAAARAAIAPEPCFNLMYGMRDGGERNPHCEPQFAQLDNRHGPIYERLPSETAEQFTSRMVNLPGRKRGGLITHFHKERPQRS